MNFERLARERRAFMALVESLSAEQLRMRAREDAWSVLEIAEHVVIAERVVLCDLADITTLPEKPHRSGFRRAIVLGVLTLGIPVEVPSRAMRPGGARDVDALRVLWDEAEAWLLEFARHEELRRRAVFEHPIAGALTLSEAVRLDLAHIRRHRRQIASILR